VAQRKPKEKEVMPFKSEQQKKWMYATHPEMAKKWAKETPSNKALPKKVYIKKKAKSGSKKTSKKD
jgi:hypothetical protein